MIENHSLMTAMPCAMSDRSNSGASSKNVAYSSGWQNPMTCSTPARLYHDLSNITISPPVGMCGRYRRR